MQKALLRVRLHTNSGVFAQRYALSKVRQKKESPTEKGESSILYQVRSAIQTQWTATLIVGSSNNHEWPLSRRDKEHTRQLAV